VSRFVFRLAWRETRGAWRHFGYFFACITLGVSALVGVGSFADSLERTVARSAKSLMGGDVEIRGTQPPPDAAAPMIAPIIADVATTRVRELVAMAQAAGPSQSHIVELKAVEPGYPFYGALVTEPARPLDTLIGGGRALVHDSLLSRLGLRVGDRFRVGDLELTIAGVILKEPDRAVGVFSLGPRVLIAGPDLDRTGLIRPGSRVRYAEGGGPDPRCYRVDCDKLARVLPDFQPQWTVRAGMKQLHEAFRRYRLTHDQFVSDRFLRIKHILKLQAEALTTVHAAS